MPDKWDYDDVDYTPNDEHMLKYTEFIFNKKAPGAGEAFTKTMSLYGFLLKHLDTPVDVLQADIIINGAPMFTEEQLTEIIAKLRTQLDTPFAKRVLGQSAGALPAAPTFPKTTFPAAPVMPDLPSAPLLPKMPSAPAMPTLPSAPAMPTLPSAPAMPTLPSAPAMPTFPKTTFPTFPPAATPGAPGAPTAAPGHGLDNDPSRSKFWDKIIRKLLVPITRYIPACAEPLLYWYFILYNLEQHATYGPFISTAFDSITLTLPVLADLSSEALGTFVSLAPIPYASFAGDALGYALSLLFVIVGIAMNNSRKHFGSSFKLALEAIPVVGEMASDGAQQFEIGAERYLQNRRRILDSIKPSMPKTAAVIEYYSPTPDIVEGPAPTIDAATLKDEVGDKVEAVTGVDVEHLIEDPIGEIKDVAEPVLGPLEAITTMDPSAVASAATAKASEAATSAVADKVDSVSTNISSAATSAVADKVDSVTTNISSAASSVSAPNSTSRSSFAPMAARKRGGTRRSKTGGTRLTRKRR